LLLTVEIVAVGVLSYALTPHTGWGGDFQQYVTVTRGWLAGEPFYPAWQIDGPYQLPGGLTPGPHGWPVLYPPYALVLFIPFTVLPAVLWWVVPVTAIAWVLFLLRPHPLAWPLMAGCLVWDQSLALLVAGNPAALWGTAAVALGLLYSWPALGVLLRPTLLPFALIGIRQRSWWIGAGIGLLVSLLFLPMWPDYLRATLNLRGVTTLYLLEHIPLLLIPLIAWLARSLLVRARLPEHTPDEEAADAGEARGPRGSDHVEGRSIRIRRRLGGVQGR
jgi:hypothetical protein